MTADTFSKKMRISLPYSRFAGHGFQGQRNAIHQSLASKAMKTLFKFSMVLVSGLAGIAVAIVVAQGVLKWYPTKPVTSPVGRMLPSGRLINLATNRNEYQNVTKGRVLLVFVTTDCDACRKELSSISQIAPGLASRLAIYAIGIEDRRSVETFVESELADVPVLLDPGAAILEQLGFRLMPTNVLLHDGVITKIWYGSSRNTTALLNEIGEAKER